ncbi:MFS general substrate transporter [Fistulina hepatica ATCC 64428]|uniref:MFS general substrate transporter n=1 Tax=Fistulina hepatica ATCC 64428 TaxID=1128425 RepID=A0A0D7AAR3_9AGAR|nr:MFS general substrate transporter [Fistulina hepatica ATCC 64428]
MRRPSAIRHDTQDTLATYKDPNVAASPIEPLSRADTLTEDTLPTLSLPDAATSKQRQTGNIHFMAVCWSLYLEGWNDGTLGPLLPVMESYFHIGYIIVALLFVVNCAGFVSGALCNVWLDSKLGIGKVMLMGAVVQLCAYIMMAPCPPFPVYCLAYCFVGFGMSLQNAQANGFVGSLKTNMTTKLGIMHAAYGFGAFCSPFAATHFSESKHWSYHWIISIGLAFTNCLALLLVFRGKRQDQLMAEAGQQTNEPEARTANNDHSMYRQIMSIRAVPLLAMFALIYIGTEVTLGGWIVTFIIDERQGGKNSGYISSGFFGGLTLGRIVLLGLNKLVGEYRVIYLYAIVSIALELTVWFVPSIIENALAVSLIGLLLGPIFPIIVSHATRVLPRALLTASVGLIGGIGMAGSAAIPFITGVIASKYGISSLQPLLVSLMVTLVVMWTLVPRGRRPANA